MGAYVRNMRSVSFLHTSPYRLRGRDARCAEERPARRDRHVSHELASPKTKTGADVVNERGGQNYVAEGQLGTDKVSVCLFRREETFWRTSVEWLSLTYLVTVPGFCRYVKCVNIARCMSCYRVDPVGQSLYLSSSPVPLFSCRKHMTLWQYLPADKHSLRWRKPGYLPYHTKCVFDLDC